MKKALPIAMTLLGMALMVQTIPAGAAGVGENEAVNMPQGMKGGMKGMFLTRKQIDGYTVSFHVMKAQAGQAMGGDHDFMVRIEKDGQVQTDLVVNSKIVYPDSSAASKMMMRMGDWYATGYDMGQDGRYQLMVLFKTPDGTRHFGGVYYPDPDGQAR